MFCKSYEPEIVFAEQFHVHKSYKMRESKLSCIGNFEENIDLSRIHLAVLPTIVGSVFIQISKLKLRKCIIDKIHF